MCCQLSEQGLAKFYTFEGKPYLQLTNWQERARSNSRFPDPSDNNCKHLLTFDNKCMLPQPQPSPQPSPTPTPSPPVAAEAKKPSPEPEKRVCVDLKSILPDKRVGSNGTTAFDLKTALNIMYGRQDADPWTYEEEHHLTDVANRPNWPAEFDTLKAFRKSLAQKKFFPQSIVALLSGWTALTDRSRMAQRNPSITGRV
jgi:hypothetical protein